MRKKNQTLKKKALERDKLTCQKCKIQDKTAKILEAHHIIPLCYKGKDNLSNLITLCYDCHKFAPGKKEEFEEYLQEEYTGTMTTFIKAWNKVRKEHPSLIKEAAREFQKSKIT